MAVIPSGAMSGLSVSVGLLFGLVAFGDAALVRAEGLKFGWPVPGTVGVTEKAVKQGNAVTMRYDVTLAPAPDGKRVAVQLKRFEFLEVNGQDARKPEIRKQLGEALKMASAIPTLIVAREGTFEEITGMDRVVKQLTASLPAEQRASVVKMMSSPQFAGMLQESSAQFWNVWVGMWTGVDLPEGKSREVNQPLPLPDGSTLDRPVQMTNQGPAGPPGHVRLAFQSKLDASQQKKVRSLLEGMIQQMAQASGQEVPKDMFQGGNVSMSGEVVTDPATLRPASARWQKQVTIQMKGQPPQSREESHDYAFAWTKAPSRKR